MTDPARSSSKCELTSACRSELTASALGGYRRAKQQHTASHIIDALWAAALALTKAPRLP
jgi:hypothetical protein